MGAAWARHAMCESDLNVHRSETNFGTILDSRIKQASGAQYTLIA